MLPKQPRPKHLPWKTPPHLLVFIRNLQLLNLHHHHDWPGISPHTLSPSSQNQRQRIKAVEWALYHLCAIWDPEITHDKLRPFFPPLESLQSVNLRAALFRVLSDLKKNGDLGKETILRKTMLDECKGEKFDELLAVFSTAVLRKALVASTDARQLNPALKASLANGISPEDYQSVLPLLLAHRVSLGSAGERRARVRGTFDKFSELLDDEKVQLGQRSQECSQEGSEGSVDSDRFVEQVKANWLGSEEWANDLLYGGSQSSSDTFLDLPFSKAWAKANESTVEGLKTGTSRDLLLDLESRVSRQRDRLSRWREFSGAVRRSDGPVTSPSINPTRINSFVAFKDHQALTVASISKAVREPGGRAPLTQDDQLLLDSMKEALYRIDGKPHSSVEETHMSLGPGHTMNTLQPRQSIPEPEQLPSPGITSHPEPDYPTEPTPEENRPDAEDTPEQEPNDESPPTITLAERTRKSMSLVAPRPPSQPQLSHEDKAKKRMFFPVNPFTETPQKQTRASTPHDDLFEDSADYASVFKSRPRIAQSPVASPAVHAGSSAEFDLDGDGRDVSGVVVDGDEYGEVAFGSPSVRRR